MDWLARMFQRGSPPTSGCRPPNEPPISPSRDNQIVDLLMTADRLASTVPAPVGAGPPVTCRSPGTKNATLKRQASSRSRPDSPDTDSVGQPDSRAAAAATDAGHTGHFQGSSTDRKVGKRESGAPICGNKRGDCVEGSARAPGCTLQKIRSCTFRDRLGHE